MAGLSQRPGGLLLGQVCWSGGHAALGHTGLSMEKPHLPARSFMVDGGSHHPIHLLHMPLTPSPSLAPTQPGASTGIRHSWWDIAKRERRSCGDSGIPFSQARCSGGISKLLFLDRNLLCHCGSRRVVPEPGKCFHLDLQDEPGLTQICSRDQAFLIPCQK